MVNKSILLNGTSSSGKSSTAEAICNLDPDYSHFAIDDFIRVAIDKNRLRNNADWPHIRNAFVRSTAIKIASKYPLVIETICWKWTTPIQLFDRIPRENLFIVGLRPPIEVLNQREKSRGDRLSGIAMEQFIPTHIGVNYDLEIDNSNLTPKKTAAMILDAL